MLLITLNRTLFKQNCLFQYLIYWTGYLFPSFMTNFSHSRFSQFLYENEFLFEKKTDLMKKVKPTQTHIVKGTHSFYSFLYNLNRIKSYRLVKRI